MKESEQIEIGRYRVQSHLARGGMADVYLAHEGESDRIVALKMVHESAGEYRERFQREVKAMSALVHKHILPVLDYGQHESWYYLVTPYIEYGTLSGRLDAGPLTLEEVDPILAQLAKALQFAHEQGVVHRDVKPSNVLMRDGNHVYLADFGLVKRVGQENGLTVTGYLIGTPEYMAPELAEEVATPQSDVYALGVLLYQMLTGRVPFKANTPIGVFLRHIRDNPDLPSTLNPTIPSQVEEVILHAMEKDPQRRYQSVQELYQAYQQAVKDITINFRVVADRPTQPPNNQPILINRVNKADREVRKQKGKGRSALLAVALVVVLLLGGVFFLVNSVFAPGDSGNSIHAADARDTKDRQTPVPAARRVTPGSTIDSSASKRPATGASGENAIVPASSTNLNQSSQSATSQQTINAIGGSGQGNDNGGVSREGQGTTNDPGNGNGVGGSQGGGQSAGSGNGGGQSTGSSGSGNGGGQSTGSSGSGNGGGQSTGSGGSGNGGGQSTGSGGSGNGGGQSTGSGGSGQGTGSSGSGGNQGSGNGGSQGGGGGQSAGSEGDQGDGSGNNNGNGNDPGNGKGKDKGDGNGKGKGKGGGD